MLVEAGDHVPFLSFSPLILLRQGFSQNQKLTLRDWAVSSREALVMPFTLCRPVLGLQVYPTVPGYFYATACSAGSGPSLY